MGSARTIDRYRHHAEGGFAVATGNGRFETKRAAHYVTTQPGGMCARRALPVISLNMAGSVPDAADLVVTDPVRAGVMAVIAVSDTAKFTIERLERRVF